MLVVTALCLALETLYEHGQANIGGYGAGAR